MKYPVGIRYTWADAMRDARDASRLTGLRYKVRQQLDGYCECEYCRTADEGPIYYVSYYFMPVTVENTVFTEAVSL